MKFSFLVLIPLLFVAAFAAGRSRAADGAPAPEEKFVFKTWSKQQIECFKGIFEAPENRAVAPSQGTCLAARNHPFFRRNPITRMIRLAAPTDAAEICGIYNHYVLHTAITFEEEAVTEREMATRISETLRQFPWLVWEEQSKVVGYAYASKWKIRSAYRYSAETTVYLKRENIGRGLGRKLYEQLLPDLRQAGVHSVIGGMALPNAASQRLHEGLGFKKVAHFEQVGRKFGKWIDVAYWELIFHPDA